jgi:hypothetical protein
MTSNGEGSAPRDPAGSPSWGGWVRAFVGVERAIFAFVGALFFIAAFALAVRATTDLWALVAGPQATIIVAGTRFLDVMLLVLMMVELAYTVIVSLRGSVLSPEPFLIVGLIAVIRRMLVITIGNVNPAGSTVPAAGAASGIGSQPIELGILTAVVLALVWSIVLLRRRPRLRDELEPGAG